MRPGSRPRSRRLDESADRLLRLRRRVEIRPGPQGWSLHAELTRALADGGRCGPAITAPIDPCGHFAIGKHISVGQGVARVSQAPGVGSASCNATSTSARFTPIPCNSSHPSPQIEQAGRSASIGIDNREIAQETFVLTADGCGLTPFVRKLFQKEGLRLSEYPGAAMTHQVIEEMGRPGPRCRAPAKTEADHIQGKSTPRAEKRKTGSSALRSRLAPPHRGGSARHGVDPPL